MNNLFDKVFIINLDGREQKLKNTLNEFEKMDITNYERFSACKPSVELLQKNPEWYNKLNSWMKIYPQYIQSAVGCKMSHINIIKMAKERGYKRILICEDDVLFKFSKEYTFETLNECLNLLQDNFDILYLGGNVTDSKFSAKLNKVLYKVNNVLSAHCYIVNCNSGACDKIINEGMNCGEEIDNYYINCIQTLGRTYILQPNYVIQRPGFSDILHREVNYLNILN